MAIRTIIITATRSGTPATIVINRGPTGPAGPEGEGASYLDDVEAAETVVSPGDTDRWGWIQTVLGVPTLRKITGTGLKAWLKTYFDGIYAAVGSYLTSLTTSTPTSLTGLLKGNGTDVDVAVAGTDYLTPTGSGAGLTGLFNPADAGALVGTSIAVNSGSIAASAPNIQSTQTWNNAAVTFEGVKQTITPMAHAAASKLISLVATGKGSFGVDATTGEVLVGQLGTLGLRSGQGPGISGPTGGSVNVGCVNGGAYLGNLSTFGASCLIGSLGVKILSNLVFAISSNTTSYGAADIAWGRNAAGVAEFNSGTLGAYRDLILRDLIATRYLRPASYTVAAANALSSPPAGAIIYISNESGGASPAYYRGGWLRISDNAAIS